MRKHNLLKRGIASLIIASMLLSNGCPATVQATEASAPLTSETTANTATGTEDSSNTTETAQKTETDESKNTTTENSNNAGNSSTEKESSVTTENNTSTTEDKGNQKEEETKVDKSKLAELIKKAEEKKSENYTPESYKTLSDTLSSAKKVYADDKATKENVEQAVKALNDAIEALTEVKKVDKSILENAIKQAESLNKELYTTASFTALSTALTNGKAIFTSETADQAAVDNATATLQSAINALVLRASNKEDLKRVIDSASAVKGFLYTPDSYKKLTTALSSATKVYEDKEAIQAEVDTKKEALDAAIRGLVTDTRLSTNDGYTYYCNVVDFGANGTDTTSDKAAIQEAMDKAGEDHKIVITVPSGTYYITGVLYIQSNTTLQLDSNATIRRADSVVSKSNMLRVTNANHKSTTYYGYTLGHDITITGGTWDGGNISNATATKDLIYIGHSQNVTISNTTIKNCYGAHALELAGVNNASITNCTFTGFRYGSDNFTSEAVQLDICDTGKSTGEAWAPGYTADGTTCKNIVVANNTFIDYPRGVGSHHVYSDGSHASGAYSGPYENITIQNNTFKRSSASTQNLCSSGIFIMGAKNITISSNTVDKYAYGIWVKYSSGVNVTKNKLKYNSNANIIYSGNTGISNATIKFTVTKDKYKTKTLVYTCPTMKTGYVKTKGKTYRFKKVASKHTVKLKSKITRNQQMKFYAKDAKGNAFYRTYYTAKK